MVSGEAFVDCFAAGKTGVDVVYSLLLGDFGWIVVVGMFMAFVFIFGGGAW